MKYRAEIELGIVCGVFILIILGVIEGFLFAFVMPSVGAEYDVKVIVQAVEKSTVFGEHTNVWVLVYGDQKIEYRLIGYHDFSIGKTYHIKFVDVLWFTYGIFPEVRGRVELKEIVL